MVGFREGLLALLAAGPSHGYQLKVDFETATGEAWPVNVGQVYTTLQRLERDGLVEHESIDGEGRRIYRITLAGRAELAEWMAQPVEIAVTNRDEVSMKLLLAIDGRGADPGAVLGVQRSATMVALQDYTRLKAVTDPHDVAWLLHLDRLIFQAEAELRWLDLVESRLDAPGIVASARRTAIEEIVHEVQPTSRGGQA